MNGQADPPVFPPPVEGAGAATETVISPADRQRRVGRRIVVIVSIVAGLAVAVIVVGFLITLPYVIVEPGSATPLTDVVSVEGAPTYDHDGELLFLTVSVSRGRPNVWEYVAASLGPDAKIFSEEDFFGDTTPAEDRRANEIAMDASQLLATFVALQELGYEVQITGTGATVRSLQPDSPADGRLRFDDVIVAVDGEAVELAEDVGTLVRARAPGEVVVFTVERGEETLDVSVTTVAADGGPFEGEAFVGIGLETANLDFEFPVDVEIDPGSVGGPSAGLAFTLAVLDELSPGDLTGGDDIAVTGTILRDGSVGEVGGVTQKAVAARRAGARLMLVPESEAAEARERAGDMAVVGVADLTDALDALVRLGGAPLEMVVAPAA